MKPRIILITSFFILFGKLHAQETVVGEWAVGIHGGYTFSTVAFMPKVRQDFFEGWCGGLILRRVSERHLGIVAEMSLARRGWREKAPSVYRRGLTYLETPFLTHIYFGNRFRFFLNLGPKVAWLLREENMSVAAADLPPQQTLPVANRLDWGLCGGPGLELHTSFAHFLLEARYYYALGNLFESRKDDTFPQSPLRTFSLNLIILRPFRQ
jgi:hypothetical protein